MIRVVPFAAPEGFSDLPVPGTHFYSQGLTPSLLGASTHFSLQNKKDSTQVSGLQAVKFFAVGPNGKAWAQDNAGNLFEETTAGQYDFSNVRSPGGNGSGLLADQYGNILYACGSSNNQLGKYDGATWNDTYQSLNSWQHPMDTYEDLVLIGNLSSVACIFSDGSFNSAAFTLPAKMTVDALRSGPTGILLGVNFGHRGALIVWDGTSPRSKYPWKWVNGNILAITPFGENWIVKTTREVLITNGVTVKQLFAVFDDPLSLHGYSVGTDTGLVQQMLIINDYLAFCVPRQINGPISSEFGKMKPGLYLYSLSRHAWAYIPVPTGNTISADVYTVFADSLHNRIMVGYKDVKLAKTYIAELNDTPPSKAVFVSEPLGIGRIKYQRVFFGPTDKSLEAAILNLGILNSLTDPATKTFNVSLKAYNFKRQLWGKQLTNASVVNHNQIQVDGTDASFTTAKVGDEVTVLEGVNAGQIAHISSIANAGTNTETWTLDTTFPNATENNIYLQVQPFTLIETKTFSNLADLKRIFYSVKGGLRGTQFLLKAVISGLGTNLQLELQTSYFVFDDLGYDQT